MANYNYFGAAYTDVVSMFRGAVAGDFGGQTQIENIMDMIEAEIVGKMNPILRRTISRVDGMVIEENATEGQAVITVTDNSSGVIENVVSNIMVWRNWQYDNQMPFPVNADLDGNEFNSSYSNSDLVITFTGGNEAQLYDIVIMSCDLDTTNAAYAINTIKQILLLGSAAIAGAKIYAVEDATPLLTYKNMYDDWMKKIADVKLGVSAIPEIEKRKSALLWGLGTIGLTGKLVR